MYVLNMCVSGSEDTLEEYALVRSLLGNHYRSLC